VNQVRVLDLRNLIDVDHDFNSIDSIPGFDQVLIEERELYVNNHGPLVVKLSIDTNIDLMLLRQRHSPTTIGSYEVERSLSAYNKILDETKISG